MCVLYVCVYMQEGSCLTHMCRICGVCMYVCVQEHSAMSSELAEQSKLRVHFTHFTVRESGVCVCVYNNESLLCEPDVCVCVCAISPPSMRGAHKNIRTQLNTNGRTRARTHTLDHITPHTRAVLHNFPQTGSKRSFGFTNCVCLCVCVCASVEYVCTPGLHTSMRRIYAYYMASQMYDYYVMYLNSMRGIFPFTNIAWCQ